MAKDTLVTAVVAKGRTVIIEAGTQEVGSGANMRKLYVPGKIAQPGDVVKLPEEEAKELMKHGFLVKPDGTIADTAAAGPVAYQEGKAAPDKAEA